MLIYNNLMSAGREEDFFKSLLDNYGFEASKGRWPRYFKVFRDNDAICIQKMAKKYPKYDANFPYLISCIRKDQIEGNKLKEGEIVKYIKFNLDKINDDDFQNVLRNGNFEIFGDKDVGSLDNNAVEELHIIPKEMGKYALTSEKIKQDTELFGKPDTKPEEKGKEEPIKPQQQQQQSKSKFKLIDSDKKEEEEEEEIKSNIKYKRKIPKIDEVELQETLSKYDELSDDDDDDDDEEYLLDRQENEEAGPLSSYRGEDNNYESHVSDRINASSQSNVTNSSLRVALPVQAPGKKQIQGLNLTILKRKLPIPTTLEPHDQNSKIMERLDIMERARYKQAGEIKHQLKTLDSLKSKLDNILTSNTTNQRQLNEGLQLINSTIKEDRGLYNNGFVSINKKIDDSSQGIMSRVSDLSGNVSTLSSQIGQLVQKPTPTIQNNVYIPKEGMDVINSNVLGAISGALDPIIQQLDKGIDEIDRVSKQIVEFQQKPTKIEEPDDDDNNYNAQFDSVNQQLTTLNTRLTSTIESVGTQLINLYNNIDARLTGFDSRISQSFSDTAQSLSSANASQIQASEDRTKQYYKSMFESALTTIKVNNSEIYDNIYRGFETKLTESLRPLNDNLSSTLQVSRDNQLILNSSNAAISTVSTTTGQIMDKANENKDLLLKLIEDQDKIGQEIQTLATYCNNSTDREGIMKKISFLSSKLSKSVKMAYRLGNREIINNCEAQRQTLQQIQDQQNKYYEEQKLIEDRKTKEKAERRKQKELQRQQEREEEDKRYNNIMDGINSIKQGKEEKQEEEEEEEKPIIYSPLPSPDPFDDDDDDDDDDSEKQPPKPYKSFTDGINKVYKFSEFTDDDNKHFISPVSDKKGSSRSRLLTTVRKEKGNNISLFVELQKLTNGNITSEEIGQIQDLDGKLTEINYKIQQLTEDMDTATENGDNEEYNNLKTRYDKIKREYNEQVAELSKEIYNLSKTKRKTNATIATKKYLMGKINKLF